MKNLLDAEEALNERKQSWVTSTLDEHGMTRLMEDALAGAGVDMVAIGMDLNSDHAGEVSERFATTLLQVTHPIELLINPVPMIQAAFVEGIMHGLMLAELRRQEAAKEA